MLFGIIFVKRSFVIPSEAFTQVDATHWVLDVSALTGGAYIDVRDVCLFVPGGGLLPLDAGLALHVQAGDSGWEYRGAVSNALPSEIFPTAWPRPEGALGYHPTAQVGVSVEPLVRACSARLRGQQRCEGSSAAQPLTTAPLDATCVRSQAELATREATVVASKQEFAKRVAVDLFRFMARRKQRKRERCVALLSAVAHSLPCPLQESFPSSPRGDALLVPTNALELWCARACAPLAPCACRIAACAPLRCRRTRRARSRASVQLMGTTRRRYRKFEEKFRRDPDFLLRAAPGPL
jgi:hypothetical protein